MIARFESDIIDDWDAEASKVTCLDLKLEKLWSLEEAGAPLIASSLSGVVSALGASAVRTLHSGIAWDEATLFAFASVAAAVPLAWVSGLTPLCTDTTVSARSLPAAISRYPSRNDPRSNDCQFLDESMSCEDKHAYRALELLMHSERFAMGFQMFGVLVTRRSVLDIFVKAALIAPTAYEFLRANLQQHLHSSTPQGPAVPTNSVG
eukprot:CAMPEP_0172701204 /NCGR_PEP_ID=MMETSP1074-20121228/31468_1 /TAXON_ID=2916 /ORGANISM="Ceratium fusus, Strain PA161109" /LENGTH=206 /DNA_ID=CAMNT_0013522719 /DNA_START=171 /DNA_END=791 /DNA_ORIENTATION=-